MDKIILKFLRINLWDDSDEGRPNSWKLLILILAFTFVLRLFLVISPEVIHNDGTEYVRHAKQILSGNWSSGKSPPLYPLLIAGVQFITQDYEMAGIWVSVIFGALLVLPIFYLGRSIFNEKVGNLSALLVAVHPFLYISSGSVLTESIYQFLLTTSVLFGWHVFKRGRFSDILLFSLFTAFAYLTRPEAIGLLLIVSIWVLLINPPSEGRRWMKRAGIILFVIIGFLVFSSPYLIQIRKETGRWGISKKAAISIGSLSGEEEAPSLESLRKRKGITLSSLIKHPWPVLGKIGTGILGSLYRFQQVYNPILFFLAVIGWIFLFKRKGLLSNWKGNFFLLTHLIFYFGFVFPFFFITKRYTSQMISISIPWAAFGFLRLIQWLNLRWKGSIPLKRFSILLLLFILTGLFIQGRVIHTREHRFIQREAGLWMKENLQQGAKVMSRLPQEAFYAELPWVRMPFGEYEVIIEDARSKGIRYLLIDEDIDKISQNFLGKMRREDLVPIRDFRREDQRIVIFETAKQE